ncbi:hypothetical protein Q7P37_003288 [Cladosporium fusiforme]
MKIFLTLFMVVLACLCLVENAEAWRKISKFDRGDCFSKSRGAGEAIVDMCFKNKGMMVPSARSKEGTWSKNHKVSVWVRSKCKPAMWVPQEWCFKQFFNMCVNMDKSGKARASCQHSVKDEAHTTFGAFHAPDDATEIIERLTLFLKLLRKGVSERFEIDNQA